MNAFLPHDPSAALAIVGQLAVELLLGYCIGRLPRRLGRLAAWLMTIAAAVIVERLTSDEPAGLRMVAIIFAVLYGLKAIVVVESETRLNFWQWLGFAMLWFGMLPQPFRKARRPARDGWRELLVRGQLRMMAGAAVALLACLIWQLQGVSASQEIVRYLATAVLFLAISLMLHFGLFNVLAGFWRALGVDCRILFRAPVLAASLSEFWSQRWNLAFSELAAQAVYRPVAGIFGRRTGLAATFLFSGLVHELAISVPVRAGYGLPMLYFTLQAVLVLFESALRRSGRPIDRHPWLGRLWVWFWIIAPLPILFHRPFLAGVVWPLLDWKT